MQQGTDLPHRLLLRVSGGLIHGLILIQTLFKGVVFIRLYPLHLCLCILLNSPFSPIQQNHMFCPVGLGAEGVRNPEKQHKRGS